MNKVTRRIGERWETGLLWRTEPGTKDLPKLPPSREVALRRFVSLEKKLSRDSSLKEEYQNKIIQYVQKGYARELKPEELDIHSPSEWYLPHFATTHPNKPRKIRIVFDAASKSCGKSLNDFLLTGTDMLPSLPGILMKFRERKIAFCGDITEMFHQVRIRKEDCPAQRFLWRDDPAEEVRVFQLNVMMFGSACSPYCAQFVRNKNASEFAEKYPAAAEAICHHHYMDDFVRSCDTLEEAKKLISEVTYIHAQGGFEIGKWISNAPELIPRGETEICSGSKDLTTWSELPVERALGLNWIPKDDQFMFKLNLERAGPGIATGECVPTKRAILRLVMLVWDPLGFLAHYMIKARILLQHLWRIKVGWDDEIPDAQMKRWISWIKRLPDVNAVRIPRIYSSHFSSSSDVQVHLFCDASEAAYACVAFFRITTPEGIRTSFVMAKSRVAPLKPISIPRLELQAAILGVRMAKLIREQIESQIHSTNYWTDSTTVLQWIRSDAKRFQTFVANRIGEIQEESDVMQWKWVPSKDNPADDATREGTTNLSPTAKFWNGPNFLLEEPEDWPQEHECEVKIESDVWEERKNFVGVLVEVPSFSYLPDINRFSKYLRLKQTTSRILQFTERIRKRPVTELCDLGDLSEQHLIRRSQWESFPKEMQLLSENKELPKSSSVRTLSPYLDDFGIMRMRSRLTSHPDANIRSPAILHPKNPLVILLVRFYHEHFAHQGENFLRNEIRQKYWIINGKTAIKKLVRECVICKKRRLKPMQPFMGDLPDFRIRPQSRAFLIVGIYFFGPLTVTVKRSREKRYGVIFVCMSTRAVHLEIAHDLYKSCPWISTDSAIMGIRRFISRRGEPKEIICDNGTNLKEAERELRENMMELNQVLLKKELEIRGIRWRFIPPRSPHMGGSYERLVKCVKDALHNILKTQSPKDEVLLTVIHEAEAVVNSRPLMEVPTDPDAEEALTPFHFLIGTSSPVRPPGIFDDKDLLLSKRWKHAQVLAEHFWKRWMREYVPTLQRRTKWHEKQPNLEIGDLVILFDESLIRGSYPMGVITATYPGRDNIVRVVDIRTSTGSYKRPAVKVGKLDIRSTTIAGSSQEVLSQNGGQNVPAISREAENKDDAIA